MKFKKENKANKSCVHTLMRLILSLVGLKTRCRLYNV